MTTTKHSEIAEKSKIEQFVPRHLNVVQYVRFWTKKSSPEVKGGSFNMDLYYQYLLNQTKQ